MKSLLNIEKKEIKANIETISETTEKRSKKLHFSK